jgi:hypothetical protein
MFSLPYCSAGREGLPSFAASSLLLLLHCPTARHSTGWPHAKNPQAVKPDRHLCYPLHHLAPALAYIERDQLSNSTDTSNQSLIVALIGRRKGKKPRSAVLSVD